MNDAHEQDKKLEEAAKKFVESRARPGELIDMALRPRTRWGEVIPWGITGMALLVALVAMLALLRLSGGVARVEVTATEAATVAALVSSPPTDTPIPTATPTGTSTPTGTPTPTPEPLAVVIEPNPVTVDSDVGEARFVVSAVGASSGRSVRGVELELRVVSGWLLLRGEGMAPQGEPAGEPQALTGLRVRVPATVLYRLPESTHEPGSARLDVSFPNGEGGPSVATIYWGPRVEDFEMEAEDKPTIGEWGTPEVEYALILGRGDEWLDLRLGDLVGPAEVRYEMLLGREGAGPFFEVEGEPLLPGEDVMRLATASGDDGEGMLRLRSTGETGLVRVRVRAPISGAENSIVVVIARAMADLADTTGMTEGAENLLWVGEGGEGETGRLYFSSPDAYYSDVYKMGWDSRGEGDEVLISFWVRDDVVSQGEDGSNVLMPSGTRLSGASRKELAESVGGWINNIGVNPPEGEELAGWLRSGRVRLWVGEGAASTQITAHRVFMLGFAPSGVVERWIPTPPATETPPTPVVPPPTDAVPSPPPPTVTPSSTPAGDEGAQA